MNKSRSTSSNSSGGSSSSRSSQNNNTSTMPDVESPAVPIKKQRSSVSFQTPPPTMRRSSSNFDDAEVSPADTFDTALTSPSTRSYDNDNSRAMYSQAAPMSTSKIVIDHNVSSSAASRGGGGSASRAMFMLGKPLIGVGLLVLLGAGGMAAWGWLFQIPGLENQVKALEEQVLRLNTEIDRLTSQVDRLEDENDRYAELNDSLNATVADLEDVTDDLEDVAIDLNTTNQELADQVVELEFQNEEYQKLNQELNSTVVDLAAEVAYFKVTLADLVYENAVLSNMTSALEVLTEQLTNTSVSQNETLTALQQFLQDLIEQNDRLEEFNANLVTLVDFLNETSTGLGSNLEEITTFLSTQIEVNQQLVLLSLENTYRQRVQNWDCEYRDVFREEPFGADFTASIDVQSQLPQVLDYVEGRVLSDLCLDATNFYTFMNAEYPDGVITSNRVIRSVLLYSELAFDYYFPTQYAVEVQQADDSSIPLEAWVKATFQCQNLNDKFSWVASR